LSNPFGLDAHRMFWTALLRAGVVCIAFPNLGSGSRDMRSCAADLRHFKDNVEAWQKEKDTPWHAAVSEWRIQRATKALEDNKQAYQQLLSRMLEHHLEHIRWV